MTFAPTADRLYGAGPPVAPVAGAPASNGNGNEAPARTDRSAAPAAVPSPDGRNAPRGADAAANLMDDPTFWAVAVVGAVLVLASASA